MSRGPLTALLAVLAVAGYQNRDKIAEVLKGISPGAQSPNPDGSAPASTGGLGDILGGLSSSGLGGLFGGTSPGGILSGGLGGLLDHFRSNGLGDRADSWVKAGPNEGIEDDELSQALGPDILSELTAKTGLSQDEILSRLKHDLPRAVDDLTPDGTIPTEQQLSDMTDPSTPSRASVPNTGSVI